LTTSYTGKTLANRTQKSWKKSHDLVDLARAVAESGTFKAYTEYSESEGEHPYTRVGTYFVPLDSNRSVALRELPKENPDDEVKVGLKLMIGEKEPSEPVTIAVFSSDNDSIELVNYNGKGISLKDLSDIEGLIRHIYNSSEK
jgi:hypothetical protein